MAAFRPGPWRDESEPWKQRLERLREDLAQKPLNILVWGAGEHSSHYPKREEIIKHLTSLNPNNDAQTSEQLTKQNPDLFQGLGPYEAEEIQWRNADMVLALVPEQRNVTGVQAELALYGRNPEFVGKACLIVPKLRAREARQYGFLDYGWKLLAPECKFQFTPRQYHDCKDIRAFCEKAVQTFRNLRYLQQCREGDRPR